MPKPAVVKAVQSSEAEIVAALGSEESALIALAENALRPLAKAQGG